MFLFIPVASQSQQLFAGLPNGTKAHLTPVQVEIKQKATTGGVRKVLAVQHRKEGPAASRAEQGDWLHTWRLLNIL